MRMILAAALATLACVDATYATAKHATSVKLPSNKELESMFSSFIKTHNKKYTHDEFFHRFTVFKQNVAKIETHNHANKNSYTLGVNEWADLTWEEFRSTKLGFKNEDRSHLRSKNTDKHALRGIQAASAVDWRTKNAVSEVKNQGQCGSCWAFSTTGSVEGAYAIAKGTLTSLSEQQLVDCSTAQGNQGCNGGLMDDAFQYIISNNGIVSEASYPYTGVQGTCGSQSPAAATISSFTDVPAGDENTLLTASNIGPVSVAIEADQEAFQLYSGGVFTAACGTTLDHGVLVVGYGSDDSTGTNLDYWIVKNSWGATWGEQGYIRLQRGINQCGLANSASYPVV